MDEEESLAQFCAITNADPSEARHLLEASDWDLDSAVQLYFENPQGNLEGSALEDESEALIRRLVQDDVGPGRVDAQTAGPADALDDEGIRRPDAVRTERLYDVPGSLHVQGMGFGSLAGARAPAAQDVPWRNFRTEDEQAGEGAGLDDIYRPPHDLISDLSLDGMKALAEKKDQWMLINVQDPKEFQSLQLNADLWREGLVKDIVRGSFQFAQRTVPGNDAQNLQNAYQLHVLPVIIVVDPHTGQKMHEWRGKPDRDKFMEELIPFMETPPSDPKAGSLLSATVKQAAFQSATPPVKGAAGVLGVSEEDESLHAAIAASLTERQDLNGLDDDRPGPSTRAAGASGTAAGSDDFEAQLARAKADSLAMQAGPVQTVSDDDGDDVMADALAPEVSGADKKAEALSRLPPPPPAGSAATCRVAIRLPEGRALRAFASTDKVQAVYDFAISSLSNEDAAKPSAFELVLPGPGGSVLSDMTSTLKDAGLAGAMLVFKWK